MASSNQLFLRAASSSPHLRPPHIYLTWRGPGPGTTAVTNARRDQTRTVSGLLRQKSQHRRLESLVSHGDQDRGADRGDLLARQGLTRASDTGRQRPEIGFGLLGKSAKLTSDGVANIRERRSLQRLGDTLRQADTVNEMNAQSAKHGPP